MVTGQPIKLLIVDDDSEFRGTLARRFARRGYVVLEAADGTEALEVLRQHRPDAAILDMLMPGMTGLELLEKLKSTHPATEVILLTGQGTIATAVKAMRLGAYDFLTKPFPLAELEMLIERAGDRARGVQQTRQLSAGAPRVSAGAACGDAAAEMIGDSAPMTAVYRLIERAGPTDKAILIQGESGTGKELVARALHRKSARADKPLVVINCAALPEALLESELFGHEKGSFTGAVSAKQGLFEIADGATLFIDEIGELAGSLQAKLLRVLEDGSMRRVGSTKETKVNVRLIAATNRDLSVEVKEGRFREDLFYRINVMSLQLPPLRDRPGDIRLLIQRFLGPNWQITSEALAALERYAWPGNVRQLINVIDRGKIMADSHLIQLGDLPDDLVHLATSAQPVGAAAEPIEPPVSPDDLRSIEKAHVLEVLRREQGKKARAARALGITRRSLYRLLDKYGLESNDSEGAPVENGGTAQSSPRPEAP
jgi:DNA-binding NtrC family response regulator